MFFREGFKTGNWKKEGGYLSSLWVQKLFQLVCTDCLRTLVASMVIAYLFVITRVSGPFWTLIVCRLRSRQWPEWWLCRQFADSCDHSSHPVQNPSCTAMLPFLCKTEEIISHYYLLLLGIFRFWDWVLLSHLGWTWTLNSFVSRCQPSMMRYIRPRWAFLIPLPCVFGFNSVTFPPSVGH